MTLRKKINNLKNTPCQICEIDKKIKSLKKTVEENKTTSDNNEGELSSRVTDLENRQDKFISQLSYERQGNNVILKFVYTDGTEGTITFEDKDTIAIAYDDTELRNLITALQASIVGNTSNGASIYFSRDIPDHRNTPNPKQGDIFIYTTTNGTVFQYDGTQWVWKGSIRGPKGDKGDPGDSLDFDSLTTEQKTSLTQFIKDLLISKNIGTWD